MCVGLNNTHRRQQINQILPTCPPWGFSPSSGVCTWSEATSLALNRSQFSIIKYGMTATTQFCFEYVVMKHGQTQRQFMPNEGQGRGAPMSECHPPWLRKKNCKALHQIRFDMNCNPHSVSTFQLRNALFHPTALDMPSCGLKLCSPRTVRSVLHLYHHTS